jgi:uncharacterized RDD family membrane protein YckC
MVEPVRTAPDEDVEPIILASIGQRALGLIIDSFLLALVILPLAYATVQKIIEKPDDAVVPLWLTAMAAGVGLIYNWALVAMWGQTLGKRIMRIRVVAVDGGRVGFQQAGIRAIVPTAVQLVPWGVGGVLSIVVYLWAIMDAHRQGLHDKAAGTLVIHNLRRR